MYHLTTPLNKVLLTAFGLGLASILCAQEGKEGNNGTDPTRPPKLISLNYEYTELRDGFRRDQFEFFLQNPISKDGRTVAKFTVPFVSTNVLGRSGYNLGDITIGATRVFKVTPKYGIVFTGEFILNTANHIEQGSGKNSLKITAIYAIFRKDGSIFAPSIVQTNSLWGESGRADVNTTTLDFYYVPKLKDKANFVTVDPNINWNWESDAFFYGLAVTLGRTLGPAFGGTSQVYIKPSIVLGDDRPANWGFEIGYKVLGF